MFKCEKIWKKIFTYASSLFILYSIKRSMNWIVHVSGVAHYQYGAAFSCGSFDAVSLAPNWKTVAPSFRKVLMQSWLERRKHQAMALQCKGRGTESSTATIRWRENASVARWRTPGGANNRHTPWPFMACIIISNVAVWACWYDVHEWNTALMCFVPTSRPRLVVPFKLHWWSGCRFPHSSIEKTSILFMLVAWYLEFKTINYWVLGARTTISLLGTL